jgi:hypothetical protein
MRCKGQGRKIIGCNLYLEPRQKEPRSKWQKARAMQTIYKSKSIRHVLIHSPYTHMHSNTHSIHIKGQHTGITSIKGSEHVCVCGSVYVCISRAYMYRFICLIFLYAYLNSVLKAVRAYCERWSVV